MTKYMYDAMLTMYQSENMSKRMLLKSKLTSSHMGNIDIVDIYLMKITKLRYHFFTVGDKITKNELGRTFSLVSLSNMEGS
jgi:hypothetical protein